MGQGDRRGFSSTSATPVSPRQDSPMPRPGAGRGPPDPGKRMVGRVHLQRQHRLWRWPRQPDRRRRVERWRARRTAGALPPAPRCLPRAARRRGVCPPQPPPQPDQRLGELQGSPMRPGPLRVLRRTRAPAGPSGGPHRPQEPGRLRRHQQPAGPLLPLQRRQARQLFPYARGRTDFRGVQASYGHGEAGCVFCALEGSCRVLLENEGHNLVIPRGHGANGLELHQPEWYAVVELLKLRREQLSAQDASISGWAGLLNARGG